MQYAEHSMLLIHYCFIVGTHLLDDKNTLNKYKNLSTLQCLLWFGGSKFLPKFPGISSIYFFGHFFFIFARKSINFINIKS